MFGDGDTDSHLPEGLLNGLPQAVVRQIREREQAERSTSSNDDTPPLPEMLSKAYECPE